MVKRFWGFLVGGMMLLILASSISFAQDDRKDGDRKRPGDKRERFRKMKPEEREKMQELFKLIQQLSPEEREWLRESLKKFKEMPPEKKKKIREFIQKFKKFSEKKEMRGQFSRRLFMQWIKGKLGKEKLEELKNLPPEERKRKMERLFNAFKDDVFKRIEEKGLLPKEKIERLKELPADERWKRLEELMQKRFMEKHPDKKPPLKDREGREKPRDRKKE